MKRSLKNFFGKGKKKKSASIYETTDYDKFEYCIFNRVWERKPKCFEALEESMQTHGWIAAYPIWVSEKDGKLHIQPGEGHRRFIVAKKLGIPVKYVIGPERDLDHLIMFENLAIASKRPKVRRRKTRNAKTGKSRTIDAEAGPKESL